MKHTLLFIALLFLVFFSCKRNEDYCSKSMAITYKYLTAGSLERTKYFTDPSFDTIKFKSSKGDTLIFVKKNTDTTWYDDFHTYGVPGCGPYLDEKNQEITNTYETIKGEGVFKVKHSLRTRLDRVSNVHDFIIDIQFSNNHFYFYEGSFNLITYNKFLGIISLADTTFSKVFYTYAYSDPELKIIG